MHAAGENAIVMRRPDGSPMTRQEVIVMRRGTMKWLPALCSNDLVHGSWWFVWGSVATVLSSIYPLIQQDIDPWSQQDDLMPDTDFEIIWSMMIISGFFFMLGSYAFVHAFEEPPQRAFFYNFKHFQTDDLLASWMFLFGSVPFVPYMLVYFSIDPGAFYFFGLLGSIVFVLGSCLFVAGCYPSNNSSQKEPVNYALPLCIWVFGPQMWVVKHLANDWLTGTWIFFWGNLLLVLVTFILLLMACGVGNIPHIFVWGSSTVCAFLYLIGSAYFVAGSYPHAFQFYYATDRGQLSSSQHTPAEVYADEIGLVAHASTHGPSARQVAAKVKSALGSAAGSAAVVVSPFHAAASKEAERAKKRMASERRGLQGGTVTGAKPGETFSPLHKLRYAGFTVLPTTSAAAARAAVAAPVLPQEVGEREGCSGENAAPQETEEELELDEEDDEESGQGGKSDKPQLSPVVRGTEKKSAAAVAREPSHSSLTTVSLG